MPETRHVVMHGNGPALWPEHKSEAAVRALEASTPEDIWFGTYQGLPSAPGGQIFKRDWWNKAGRRRDVSQPQLRQASIGRWVSLDTAFKSKDHNDRTACVVMDLLPDYRAVVTWAWADRIPSNELPAMITDIASAMNRDRKLRGIVVEDQGSGITVLQTLRAAQGENAWIAPLMMRFAATQEKKVRWKQAAIWCQNGCVHLPIPNDACPWLLDLEDELFLAPSATHDDLTDAFSQCVLFLEHILSRGQLTRGETAQHN